MTPGSRGGQKERQTWIRRAGQCLKLERGGKQIKVQGSFRARGSDAKGAGLRGCFLPVTQEKWRAWECFRGRVRKSLPVFIWSQDHCSRFPM